MFSGTVAMNTLRRSLSSRSRRTSPAFSSRPRLLEAAENIVVTATLDVATLTPWSGRRTRLSGGAAPPTRPHAGQGASLALEDAMRLGRLMQAEQELGVTFAAFESEGRRRAARVGSVCRR